MTRRWLRWLSFALLAVLLLVGAGVVASWYILRGWGPELTREKLEAALADALGQPVRIGDVRFIVWRGRVSLSNIVSEGPPDGIGLRIPVADVDLGIASLWRRRVTVSVTLHDLDLRMSTSLDGGGGTVPFPLPEFFEAGPVRVAIGSIRVVRGHAVVREAARGLALEVRDADADARPSGGNLDLAVKVGGLRVESPFVSTDFETVAVDAHLSADAIQIKRADLRWQGESLRLDGVVREPWKGAPQLAIRANGAVALGPLASMLGAKDLMTGVARVTAVAAGPVASLRVDGGVSVPALTIGGAAVRDVSIDAHLSDGSVRLEKIHATLGTGRLDATLTAAPVPADVTRVVLDVRDLTLPEPLTGVGAGTGTVEVTVARNEIKVQRGHVAWKAMTLDVGGRIDTAGPLAVNARLAADLDGIARATGAGDLGGRATLTADVTGTSSAPEVAGRVAVAALTVGGQSVDPADASFRLAAVRGRAGRWDGTIQSPRIGYRQAPVQDFTARLTLDGTRVEVVNARARAATVPVELTGVWDWAGSGRARATLGPSPLASLPFVPSTLGLAGTGRGDVDATYRNGVLDTNATVKLERTSLGKLALGDGTLAAHTRGRTLQAEFAMPARSLRVEANGPLRPGSTITAKLAVDGLALRPLLVDLGSGAADQLDGRLTARGTLSIPYDDPAHARGSVQVQPENLRIAGEPWTSRAPIAVTWDGDRARIERARLEGPSGTLTASGTLAGSETDVLTVTLENARLPGALAELGRGAARADVRIAGGGIELKRLDGRWPGLVVGATGQVRGDGTVALDATGDADLAPFSRNAVAGRGNLALKLRGSLDALEGTGHLQAPRLQASGVVLTDVNVPLRFTPNVLSIAEGHALLGGKRIAVVGTARWSGPEVPTTRAFSREVRFTAEVRAPSARFEDLSPLLPSALQGRGELAFSARVEGTPSKWRGNGTVSSPAAELAMGPLRRMQVPFTLDESGIDVADLRADVDSVPVRGSASWRWAGGGRTNVTLGPAELRSMTMIPPGVAARGTARATVQAALDASANLTGEAHAAFDGVVAGGVTLGRGRIDATARDRGFRAEIDFPEAKVRAVATGQIDAQQVLEAQGTLADFPLTVLARALLPETTAEGALSARATARVPLKDPRRGDGTLTIDPVRFTVGGEQWRNREPIEVRWTADGLRLPNVQLAGNGGVITARGTLAQSGALDARVDGRLPLAMLPALQPAILEGGGTLEIALRATGSVGAPALTGDGTIRKGSILLRDRPEALRDLEARFSLSNQGVQLQEATANMGSGTVRARGDAALDAWRVGAYRVRVTAKSVALSLLEGLSAAWDADLELAGVGREARLRGDVNLVRGVYTKELSLLPLLLSSRRDAAAEEGGLPLRLSLRVRLDDNLAVRSRTVDIRATGRLNVEGTAARPAISGSITSQDGRVQFRSHDWTVTSASVRFTDPRRLDPYLEVIAQSRIRDYDVTLHVTGPSSDVKVELTSQPRLARDDLLALVAFGSTRAELADSPGAVVLGEAGKIIARDLFGFDPASSNLRVSSGSATDSPTTKHTWEGEDPARTYPSRNASGERKQSVRVEYRLLDPLFLSTEYDLDGGYGADLVFRFRFR